MKNDNVCANCNRDLDIGLDAIKVEEGVVGTRGFVPLDHKLFFCCEQCLHEYFDLDDLPGLPRRIP